MSEAVGNEDSVATTRDVARATRERMAAESIPVGTDDPLLLALGAKGLDEMTPDQRRAAVRETGREWNWDNPLCPICDKQHPPDACSEAMACAECEGRGYHRCHGPCSGVDDLGCEVCQGALYLDCETCKGTGVEVSDEEDDRG